MKISNLNFFSIIFIFGLSLNNAAAVPFNIDFDSRLECDIKVSHTHKPHNLVIKEGLNNNFDKESTKEQEKMLKGRIWLTYDHEAQVFHTNFGGYKIKYQASCNS